MATRRRTTRQNPGWMLFVFVLSMLMLLIGAGVLLFGTTAYGEYFEGRILPGVHVLDVDVGGLSVEEAMVVLAAGLPDPRDQQLTLYADEDTWRYSWADLGIVYGVEPTAALAYRFGRVGPSAARVEDQLYALAFGVSLAPVVLVPHPKQLVPTLETLAGDVYVPPVDAALVVQPGGVMSVPARAGRALDAQGTASLFGQSLVAGPDGLSAEVQTHPVEPAIVDTEAARSQAEALLAGAFTLAANDPLTGFRATWRVEQDALAGWLVAKQVDREGEAQLVLTVEAMAIQAYLGELGTDLPSEVGIDEESTHAAIRSAVEAGEDRATAVLIHPPYSYTVQYGDTLTSVAMDHGFPLWWMEAVNQGIPLGQLRPGQQLTIPSLDILFPLPLITDRRIVVDLSDQHCMVYEGERQLYDFVCSTGIASSPTFPGTFQVLNKEENAYASSWDLWMPHFIGVYKAAPDFTNGFHALPILSNGGRLWEGYLGRPVSYGCIVLGIEEAAILYEWAELGTLVVIQE